MVEIIKKYNYPIKQVRAFSEENVTRIVIDLYEYINWAKRIKVLPWPIIPNQNKKELVREGTSHIHEIK